MGNFKVKVNSEVESREVQELLFSIGRTHDDGSTDHYQFCFGKYPHFINCEPEYISSSRTGYLGYDEITIAELRDMVASQHSNDEPFLTPECTLNDQYAETEQVRQAIKAPGGNDSDHALDTMSFGIMGVGRDKARQHRHYFIDVSDVSEIDFYEIALRYNVTDPCIQHILKKCLAVGQRGQKDFHHDLEDIYDTAKRMLAVHGLDS